MYEYTIYNKTTNEETMVFGRDYTKAMEKAGYNKTEWVLLRQEYVD